MSEQHTLEYETKIRLASQRCIPMIDGILKAVGPQNAELEQVRTIMTTMLGYRQHWWNSQLCGTLGQISRLIEERRAVLLQQEKDAGFEELDESERGRRRIWKLEAENASLAAQLNQSIGILDVIESRVKRQKLTAQPYEKPPKEMKFKELRNHPFSRRAFYKLTPEMSEFMGLETASVQNMTRHFWNHVKAYNLPRNKGVVTCDDKLRKVFGDTVNMVGVRKAIARNCLGKDHSGFEDEEEWAKGGIEVKAEVKDELEDEVGDVEAADLTDKDDEKDSDSSDSDSDSSDNDSSDNSESSSSGSEDSFVSAREDSSPEDTPDVQHSSDSSDSEE